MLQTFTHFTWSTLNPVRCGNNLTLLVKVDGVEIDSSHAWLGFNTTNYWIKATTNLAIAWTYKITSFVKNGA
jgi:hypothetical protein